MTYWVIRWWGSKGIISMEGKVSEDGEYFETKVAGFVTCLKIHNEAFPSREAAEIKVQGLAGRKVDALRAQAERLVREWGL